MSTDNIAQFQHVLNTFFEPDSAVLKFLHENGVDTIRIRSLKTRWKKWENDDELKYTDPEDTNTKKNLSEEELDVKVERTYTLYLSYLMKYCYFGYIRWAVQYFGSQQEQLNDYCLKEITALSVWQLAM